MYIELKSEKEFREKQFGKYSALNLGRPDFYKYYREHINKYIWVIEALKDPQITKNIDYELRGPLVETSIVMMKLFGDIIDWKGVINELKTSPIRLRSAAEDPFFKSNPRFFGYFNPFPWLDGSSGKEDYARIVVRKRANTFSLLNTFIHEYSHFLHSVSAGNTFCKLYKGKAAAGIERAQLVNGLLATSGKGLNEGVNNLITQIVFRELMGNSVFAVKYKANSINDNTHSLVKYLNNITDGKLITSAFKSKPDIIADEFKQMSGGHTWSRFVHNLDIIYYGDMGHLSLENEEREACVSETEDLVRSFARKRLALTGLYLTEGLKK